MKRGREVGAARNVLGSNPVDEIFDPTHPGGRLFVVGSVCGIIGGFDPGKPLHAGGVDLCDAVPEGRALDIVFDLAILEGSFQSNELPLLQRPCEL